MREQRDDAGNAAIVDVTASEMLAAMDAAHQGDDSAVFRYFQTTLYGTDGCPTSGPTLRLTVGQLRKDVGCGS